MTTVGNKNAFASAAHMFDDSDEEVSNKKTKTQVKKEKNAIAESATIQKTVKVSAGQKANLESQGFNMVDNVRPATASRGNRGRGGNNREGGDRPERRDGERGGFRGGDRGRGERGGRGGRGGDRGGRGGRGGDRGRGGERGRGGRGGRPDTAVRTDADGNPIQTRNRREGADRREGDETKEHGGYDRRDGTGRGDRRGAKRGAGKFNEGERPEAQYKKKDADTVEAAENATAEESKVAVAEPAEQYEEVVYGVSFDDYFADKKVVGAKAARNAQGVGKDTKVLANTHVKEHDKVTLVKNQYGYTTHGKTKFDVSGTGAGGSISMGFQAMEPESEGGDEGRGGRGGRGRGGRGGRTDQVREAGGKRQNARQALKKTEDDFPTL